MARIAVIGTGYVGLTTGSCFAHLGHDVICSDIDYEKIANLRRGDVPILESGLQELVVSGIKSGRLQFTNDSCAAVSQSEFIFLCVPTPQSEDGRADLSYVKAVADEIANALPRESIVVNKSTVPVGSTRIVEIAMRRPDVFVVSNPEFLREGTAVHDFLQPDRVVVGSDQPAAAMRVAALYDKIGAQILVTDAASAEMIKYAANAFLATKLSFVNAIATICENVGADIRDVVVGIGYDKRIGHEFLRPGPGWGGSCFPKDTAALLSIAEQVGYQFDLLREVVAANTAQFERVAQRIATGLEAGDTVAVWGLTFKALTDDLRDSPSLEVVRRLLDRGLKVSAYDPAVNGPLLDWPQVDVCSSELAACRGASALAVLTEWENFRWVNPADVAGQLRVTRVIDARNVLDRSAWENQGFSFQGIGRR